MFTAKYPGKCAGCGDYISPGTEVHYVEDELCHADCSDLKPEPKPRPVCMDCFTEIALNGTCSC